MGVAVLCGCTSFVSASGGDADTEAGSSSTGAAESTQGPTTDPTQGTTTDGGTTTNPSTTDTPTTAGTTTADTDPTTGPDPTTGDPGSSGGADESSGGRAESSSSGTVVPGVCGDGNVDAGESCDDDNGVEIDGCTSNCEFGPTGIDYGAVSPTGLGGGGGTVIDDNTDDCPPDNVLVGLQGSIASMAEPWIGVIGGVCRPADLSNADPPAFVTGAPAFDLTPHGGFNSGGDWATECDDDEVIVAVRGNAGSVVDGLEIRCASIQTIGMAEAYDLEPIPLMGWEPLQGSMGGAPFGPLVCPPGEIATGLRVQTSSYLNQIQLRCQALDLIY